MSKDGTNVREIVAQWLRENHYDGLCNPDGECGCGLDDLMPCQCINERECVCAYEIPVPDGSEYDRFYCTSNSEQDQPSDSVEQIAKDMMTCLIEHERAQQPPHKFTVIDHYRNRLEALGVRL